MNDEWNQLASRYVAGDPRLIGDIYQRLDDPPALEPDLDELRIEHHPNMDAGPSFVRFEDEQWLDAAGDDDNWCFLCEYSQDSTEFDGNRDYARILKLIKDHYGKTTPETLARMVQQFYDRFLRPCIEHPRPWSKRSIHHHIERHRPDAYNMTVDAVRTITNAMHLLKDGGMCMLNTAPDGTSTRTLNATNTRLYLTLVDRQQRLINSMNRMGNVQSNML